MSSMQWVIIDCLLGLVMTALTVGLLVLAIRSEAADARRQLAGTARPAESQSAGVGELSTLVTALEAA